jgi:hypothetical protein
MSLPPKPASEVEILSAPPSRPYNVVAEFQGIGLSEDRIKSQGAKLGADAVYVASYNISFLAADGTVASPRNVSPGTNSESLCTAISYR